MKSIKYKNPNTQLKNWCIQITYQNRNNVIAKITDLDSSMIAWPFCIGSYYGIRYRKADGSTESWNKIITEQEFNQMFNINDDYEIY